MRARLEDDDAGEDEEVTFMLFQGWDLGWKRSHLGLWVIVRTEDE